MAEMIPITEGKVKSSPDDPRQCDLCKITFPDVYFYIDHIESSKRHKKNVMKKTYGKQYLKEKANLHEGTRENGDESSTDDETCYPCEPCKKNCLGKLNYKLHIAGKKHQRRVKRVEALKVLGITEDPRENQLTQEISSEKTIEKKEGPRKCETCGIIYPDVCSYADHLTGIEHENARVEKKYGRKDVKEENICQKSDKGVEETYSCEVCNVTCSGKSTYEFHLLGKKHAKNLAKRI